MPQAAGSAADSGRRIGTLDQKHPRIEIGQIQPGQQQALRPDMQHNPGLCRLGPAQQPVKGNIAVADVDQIGAGAEIQQGIGPEPALKHKDIPA